MEVLAKETIEERVIAQLRGYKTIIGRIKVLEKYPIGNGLYLTEPFDEDDKLQPLHRQLRNMPSHMYLTNREQKLEEVANIYLPEPPVSVREQHWMVKNTRPLDEHDQALMKELADKIGKVAATRGSGTSAFEAVLERVTELDELQKQKGMIDFILATVAESRLVYAELLRLLYIEDKTTEEVSRELNVHRSNLNKWRKKAIQLYSQLAGIR